ncbi:hypothetical protein HYDPIDRAFT_117667 [Hydnomerulius pinastri MD-312]|uniref:Uncharacterized protein n=1 Tax=Hydnomerulius pinastri MD-312 TaxID=994086 RepID=A0A0C9VJV9_9AGAM|nr:hypothetical protein HYDPIDRAFT_120389 [Hydnomerulius pinastri MD-312]KIJ57881.1 hypothetical protein HYDPIDRAFT_120227 [Hydnomerulius pinastri MD-312]KIJ59218.1 hypothetical protein HYDPIDRAFT_118749 [Hydnomerulius pinastri MD-312]KIJ60005.1 hypothetical protein HYDPIDRAFT_117667 [Hydnomerulius pinastri MD-312]
MAILAFFDCLGICPGRLDLPTNYPDSGFGARVLGIKVKILITRANTRRNTKDIVHVPFLKIHDG